MLALAIVCALQGVVASVPRTGQPTILTVRAAGDSHGVKVPLVVRGDGQLVVRADLIATALGGSSKRLSNGHYAVSVPGVTLDIADQSGFATSSAGIVPLPVPATVDHGILYLPLAVVADVLPRVGIMRWRAIKCSMPGSSAAERSWRRRRCPRPGRSVRQPRDERRPGNRPPTTIGTSRASARRGTNS